MTQRRRPSFTALVSVLPMLLAFLSSPARADTGATFTDVSTSIGIDVLITGLDREDWGFGSAFADYDGDGDLDLYVAAADGEPNRLFRLDPDGSYTDVAVAAGVADTRNGRAVKFADYDNDGDQDFFLGNYRAANCLYRNNGDGTFTDVADSALASGLLTFGGAWGDFDGDGWIDLYVVNRRFGRENGINQLYHNQGDGTFAERAAELGVDDEKAGLEAVWFDYDNDGDVDLYLSNDKWGGNRLWRNEAGVSFTDVSVDSRANVTINSMGVAPGDYDGNGYVDLYLTNTSETSGIKNVLLRNNGDGTFDNVAFEAGVLGGRYAWGTAFFDYDNDGDLDLYVVNWDAQSGVVDAQNQLFVNHGDGTFSDMATVVGAADSGSGYGLSIGDFNEDGALDMFVTNNMGPSVFYENTGGGNRWLVVCPVGVSSNRDGIGARVRVVGAGGEQLRDISGGSSYLCHHAKEAHFGLGGLGAVDAVEVQWPSGCVDRLEDVATNQRVTIVEGGTGRVEVSSIDVVAGESGGIDVLWEVDCTPAVSGFRVYRRDTETDEEYNLTEVDVSASARAYNDAADLIPGRLYGYVVAAVPTGAGAEVRSHVAEIVAPGSRNPGLRGFVLEQYPNPFNPGTTIAFELTGPGPVTLRVFDAAGRLVDTLVDEPLAAGLHDVEWLGSGASSGVYFCRLETPEGALTRKMVLVK